MTTKKVLKVVNYEQGLLISAITRALTCDNDFAPDDVKKLKDLKVKLQELSDLKH